MAISFQKTEKTKYILPEEGPYFAKITNAEMRNPKDPAGNPYMNLTYEIYNARKEKKGIIFDMLSTSDAQFPQYKMSRFITVLGLDGKEFKSYDDICKVVKDRKLGFFITPDTSDYIKANPDKARMMVNTRDEGIFYTTAEIAEKMSDVPETPAPAPAEEESNDSAPFDINDDF